MVTEMQARKVKGIKVEFAEEAVTAMGGLVLVEEAARRLGLWRELEGRVPRRAKGFDWLTVIKSAVSGLLSGSQGTYATEEVREDGPLLRLLNLEGAPEEATLWRALKALGEGELGEALGQTQRQWARRVLARGRMRELLVEGFFPIFGDGTLLEGSDRREGTKTIEGKGRGLLWGTVFAGPVLAGQRLAAEGEGEQTVVREVLPAVVREVVEPLKLKRRALVLLDSLHGDGPTLDEVEGLKLQYIIGANKLAATEKTLAERASYEWQATGPDPARNWAESAVCQCWLQCEGWTKKRLLVGRRWRFADELPGVYHYSGVVAQVADEKVRKIGKRRNLTEAEVIWFLYDHKAAMENEYKDLLEDLALHYPPCQEYVRNAGFYALGALAHTLGRAVQILAGPVPQKNTSATEAPLPTETRPGVPLPSASTDEPTRRRQPRRMRLWRLRRRLFALPARIAYHARYLTVTFLGVRDRLRREFAHFWSACCRC